uniref:Uncharacterized protein n=1 Tax=Pyxicephalus adspersus TaxID=30357 RepID=A0AAV3AWZ9_PYXAD|nr:TPA: hypothetical protein GDO54_011477 [Pyxicephalus adspersus]
MGSRGCSGRRSSRRGSWFTYSWHFISQRGSLSCQPANKNKRGVRLRGNNTSVQTARGGFRTMRKRQSTLGQRSPTGGPQLWLVHSPSGVRKST